MRDGSLEVAAIEDLLVVGAAFFLGAKNTEVLKSLQSLPHS